MIRLVLRTVDEMSDSDWTETAGQFPFLHPGTIMTKR
jgi:hypothetical protein